MRNLATIFPFPLKFSGKFWHFNAINGSIKMLKNGWLNFQKFQLKWKIVNHFTKIKQRIVFRKLFNVPPTHPHQIKPFYVFRAKFCYRYIHKYTDICFQITSRMQFLDLRKWCSANVISDTKQNNVCWKYFKIRKVFGCIAGAYSFQCQVSWG